MSLEGGREGGREGAGRQGGREGDGGREGGRESVTNKLPELDRCVTISHLM